LQAEQCIVEENVGSTLCQGMMGKTLVDLSQSSIPVVIGNFSGTFCKIKKGTHVGQCHEVEALAEDEEKKQSKLP